MHTCLTQQLLKPPWCMQSSSAGQIAACCSHEQGATITVRVTGCLHVESSLSVLSIAEQACTSEP